MLIAIVANYVVIHPQISSFFGIFFRPFCLIFCLGRVLPRALVSLLCLPLLFGDTFADVLLFVDSNYGTLCENSFTIIIHFLRFISLFSLFGGEVGLIVLFFVSW